MTLPCLLAATAQWLASGFMIPERRPPSPARVPLRICGAILTLLGNRLSRVVQPLEGRNPGGCKLIPIQPGDHANEIDRSSNAEMMQMRFCQTDVARTAHAKGANPLRNGSFDPGACSV